MTERDVRRAMGRLSAAELHLTTHVYDPTVHTEEVRRNWFGLDITHSDGRQEMLDVMLEADEDWNLDE